MTEHRLDRRQFIRQSATAIGAALVAPVSMAAAPPRRATDLVPLGRTGVRMARLGIGTGSSGGDIQRALGQESFTRLLRYAVERGVTYIDTADNYRIHDMVGVAIKGLPREQLFIQTKMPWDRPPFQDKPREALDRYRRELGVEYIDSLLLHCAVKPTWPDDLRRMMDVFDEAKRQQVIRVKGVSCHGLPALTAATGVDWVDVHLARINHRGHHMDGADGTWAETGNKPAAMEQIQAMHAKGRGIIGMKLVGNGDFTTAEDRERALQFALTCGCVDAVVMGFKLPAEIDEAIARMDRILATA